MAFNHARIVINNSAPTKVTPNEWADLGPNTNCTLQIQNLGSEVIYVGGEGLTNTSYGCALVAGATLTIDDLPPKDNVYALSSTSTSYIGILRIVR